MPSVSRRPQPPSTRGHQKYPPHPRPPCPRLAARLRWHRRAGRRASSGHTLLEPIVALVLLAVGALGAAAVLAHAVQRLARTAQLGHTRDDALARAMRSAAQPCLVPSRAVQPLTIEWVDSATRLSHVRAWAAPCAE